MIGRLKYVLLLVVSLCYLQGACEINTGFIANTFGDQYDIYLVPSESVEFETQKTVQVHPAIVFTSFSPISTVNIEIIPIFTADDTNSKALPRKLFLKYRSILI